MKVDQRGIEAIRLKVDRAYEHFTCLHAEMRTWDNFGTNNRPWVLLPEVHENGRKHWYRVRFLKPMPVEWAVILGEALHDLRSALDQAVYWLTIDWIGKRLDGTAFPVCRKRAHFTKAHSRGPYKGLPTRDSGLYKVRGLGPGPLAFVEALQPYPQRWRSDHVFAIKALNELWNQDKHRLVHLFGLHFANPQVRFHKTVAPDIAVLFDNRVKHDHAIVLKLLCDPPHPQVEMLGQIWGAPSIFAGQRAHGANLNMWDIAGHVVDVINKLVAAIGRQTRPINSRVWSVSPRPPWGAQLTPPKGR